MSLLFNKEGNGDKELKSLLGFLDANLKYINLESDIISATNDVIDIIGKATYETATTAYYKESPSDAEKELIHAVRYPIVVQAYRHYAPSNDLRHTTSGRKNQSEEYEKAPFEWQIDRDNKSLEKRFYRALDDMINYLDANSSTWKESDLYKSTFNLFIRTTKQFDDIFPIGNSRLLFIMLTPGMRKSQDNDIIPRIGTDLANNIIKKLRGDELPDFTIDKQLLTKIREAMAYKALAWAYPRYSIQLYPEGTLQAYTSDRTTTKGTKPPEKSEIPSVSKLFDADAMIALKAIEEMMTVKEAPTPIDPATIEPMTPYINEDDQFLTT